MYDQMEYHWFWALVPRLTLNSHLWASRRVSQCFA